MAILGRILLILALSAGFSIGSVALQSRNQHFSPLNWRLIELDPSAVTALDSPLLLDARERDAFDEGHIPNAISLSESTWDADIIGFLNEWRPEREVVVYCSGQACGASRLIALRLLGDLPGISIYILRGGFPAWAEYQSSFSVIKP